MAWEVPSDFSCRARRVGSRGGIVSRRLADNPPPPIHPLGTRENHTLGIAFRGTGVKPDPIDSNLAPMGEILGCAQIGARHPVRRQAGC